MDRSTSGRAATRRIGIWLFGVSAFAALFAMAACGLPKEEKGEAARILATEAYGTKVVVDKPQTVKTGDTPLRALERLADVEAAYGGAFVEGIDGVGTKRSEPGWSWIYYLNGVAASTGAGETDLRPGANVWFDYHSTSAGRGPKAVVGAWPQPFSSAGGEVAVLCFSDRAACESVLEKVKSAGAARARMIEGRRALSGGTSVFVGEWSDLERVEPAAELRSQPKESGVFATFTLSGELEVLTADGETATTGGPGSGLVAAVAASEGTSSTWIVTGADAAGVRAAAGQMTEDALAGHFALAVIDGRAVGAPAPAAGGQSR